MLPAARLFGMTIIMGVLSALYASAQTFETRATAAYVLDQSTGTVLMAKNADEPLPPASMSKLMTKLGFQSPSGSSPH